ncbi:hypothetical protein H6768_04195 [Candidatus Peribacteria bacterium]|nr:hypothetical protein [Candidatus Peribacteria bacterium]
MEQYERFKKDFEHRLSARLHTLSISQKKALNGISYNYQTFYSAIVQIANNSPQAKDDLTDVARSLVAAQKNVNLNIVIPPAELDENKVGKKSADMYRNALRTYNDNM